ncbi:hypothetical protein Tco_0631803 [Tanacetum coccineum]
MKQALGIDGWVYCEDGVVTSSELVLHGQSDSGPLLGSSSDILIACHKVKSNQQIGYTVLFGIALLQVGYMKSIMNPSQLLR